MEPFTGDLVCWDFGDTLVDQRFMWAAPPDLPGWSDLYGEVLGRGDFVARWEAGETSMRELCRALSDELDVAPARIWRILTHNLTTVSWYEEVRTVVEALEGEVLQAVVTVNPHELWAAAVACDLHTVSDCIVTSADAGSTSKVDMAIEAREMLGLPDGLGSTLLVDNLAENTDEFVAAGGQALHFVRAEFPAAAAALFQT